LYGENTELTINIIQTEDTSYVIFHRKIFFQWEDTKRPWSWLQEDWLGRQVCNLSLFCLFIKQASSGWLLLAWYAYSMQKCQLKMTRIAVSNILIFLNV